MAGCRLSPACNEIGITLRTFQRWVRDGDDAIAADSRATCARPEPANKLSEKERSAILEVANCEEFASLPPSQIVPTLADRGVSMRLLEKILGANALRVLDAVPPRGLAAAAAAG